MENNHFILETLTIFDALKRINSMRKTPLVLFVMDKNNCMKGTLTDGDIRRAILKGVDIHSFISYAMNRDFNYLRKGDDNDVENICKQRELAMKLVPVLDNDNHVIDIIDLERYHTKLPIDAVLMAGGKGMRLRPLTEKIPKPLLKVGEKAIIDYNIDRLIDFGVKHINVTVNYLAEQIEQHFAEPYEGIQVKTFCEKAFYGTIGGVKIVEEFFNDTILVMNSDLFTNIDYENFYLHFKQNNADMSVAAVPYTINVPYGIFELEGNKVKGVLEKPIYNYFANAGIYLIKRSVLDMIPDNQFYNATDLLDKLISEKKTVVKYPIIGYWIDIGCKEEYEKAQGLVCNLVDKK